MTLRSRLEEEPVNTTNTPIAQKVMVLMLLGFAGFSSSAPSGDENWDGQFGVPGANADVLAAAIYKGDLIAGGGFSQVGGVNANNIAKWDGTNWSPLRGGVSWVVTALAVNGPDLYVGGYFTMADGIPALRVAKWDGANWSALGSGVNDMVEALAVRGSDLYVGGQFTSAGGLPARRLAKWDGASWSSVGALTNSHVGCSDGCYDDAAVFALAVHGTDLYVGGRFVYAGGVFTTNIAKWDGTNWSGVGTIMLGQIQALAAARSGVYVGSGGPGAIVLWDGTNWSGLGTGLAKDLGPPVVHALLPTDKGIYVAGSFSWAGGIRASNIAQWDGACWKPLGSGIGTGLVGVRSLTSNGSELFVGGSFSNAGGKPSSKIALWHIPHALTATRHGDLLSLSWPGGGTNFLLEGCDNLGQTNWSQVLQSPAPVGSELVVTQELCSPSQFYRLRRK